MLPLRFFRFRNHRGSSAIVSLACEYFHFLVHPRWLEAVPRLKAASTLITTLPSWSTTLDSNRATSQRSPLQPPSSQNGWAQTRRITLTRGFQCVYALGPSCRYL